MGLLDFFRRKNVKVSEIKEPVPEKKEEVTSEADNQTVPKAGKAKRKTLPKDIEDYIKDDAAVKAVFDKCDINAYRGYIKGNIFFFKISEAMIKWCIEQGADINYLNHYGRTALMEFAGISNPEYEKQALLLIENGADIHIKERMGGKSALFYAVKGGNVKVIEALLEAGADLSEKDNASCNPLEAAFKIALPIDLIKLVPVSKMLISKGVSVTETIKNEFIRIAKDIEFRRSPDSGTEFTKKIDEAMDKLYVLLDVERVPARKQYDGKSEIRPKADTWQKQHAELWELLVPGSGHASTVQGEVIRISGKLAYEILDNGCMNWDSDYQALVKALVGYLKQGNVLSSEEMMEIAEITKGIKNKDTEDLNRLTELAVKWVIQNPMPIQAESIGYRR